MLLAFHYFTQPCVRTFSTFKTVVGRKNPWKRLQKHPRIVKYFSAKHDEMCSFHFKLQGSRQIAVKEI